MTVGILFTDVLYILRFFIFKGLILQQYPLIILHIIKYVLWLNYLEKIPSIKFEKYYTYDIFCMACIYQIS